MQVEIQAYEPKFRDQLISVWERSVKATHHFVSPSDIDFFKQLVEQIDFSSFNTYCLIQDGLALGFIGTFDDEIAMLFLDPDHIGKGLGKRLMLFALNNLKAQKVEVNEQNVNAVGFYSKFGFVVYERTENDSQGKDSPVLKMKLRVT